MLTVLAFLAGCFVGIVLFVLLVGKAVRLW